MGQDLFPTQVSENFDKLFNVAGEPVDIAIYAHVHHDLLRYGSDERMVLNQEKQIADKSDLPYRDLYKKMMVTGRAYTHDDELLTEYNNQYNYADEYRKYTKKLNG